MIFRLSCGIDYIRLTTDIINVYVSFYHNWTNVSLYISKAQ